MSRPGAAKFHLLLRHILSYEYCPPRPSLANLVTANEPLKFQQVRNTAKGSRLAHYDLGIRGRQIRPLTWNSTNDMIVDLQQESLAAVPAAALSYTDELLPAKRMEGMDDPHKMLAYGGTICISN